MKRSILVNFSLPLLVISVLTVAVLGYVVTTRTTYEKQRAKDKADAETLVVTAAASGNAFLVQGRRVNATVVFARHVRRGDSLGVVLRLDKGAAGSTAGLGDEHDGELTPTLSVGDCDVTPQHALSKATNSYLAAFVWGFSVDGCKTVGDKAVQMSLLYTRSGPPNGSDPLAFRGLDFVEVSDDFSPEDFLKVLGGVTTALTAISVVVAAFNKKKPPEDESSTE